MPIKNNIIPGPNYYNDETTMIKLIDPFAFIKHLQNGLIIIPPFQRDLDNEKINLIQDKMLKHNNMNWLIQQNPIHLGYIESETSDKLYVIDGQHRIKAVEQLLNLQMALQIDLYDKKIDIMIIKFDTMSSMKNHFLDININSNIEPIYKYFDDELIKSTILKLKNHFKLHYSSSFRRTLLKSPNTHNHHINEFIELFNPQEIKKLYDKKNEDYGNVNLLIEIIMIINLIVKEKLFSYQTNNTRKFYMSDKEYQKCVLNSFYLPYDNINFIDYLLNYSDDIELDSIIKPKIKLSSKMRNDVWTKRNDKLLIGKCHVCQEDINYHNFHCGHIISEKNGGLILLDNLEPICMQCNLTMGTENLIDYKNKLMGFRKNINYIDKLAKII
jgi:5-methylcytosine-specific restriction endonuclease McrA